MKIGSIRICFALLIMVLLTAGTIWPVAAREAQPVAAGESVMLRLKYATFDPLQGEPQMPPALHIDAQRAAGEGAYIVQFFGPIRAAWTDQIRALGGRVMGYLPDFAYLVWMDGAARDQVAALDSVRWVGLYQPAYKLSPNLDRTMPLYRIVLFEGADLGAVSARLATLNTPTRQVTGEQFALLLPDGGVDEVANWPEVLWIENRPLYTVSNDVATGIMRATTAWGNGYTGTDQKVTVADTGIDTGTDVAGVVDMHADFNDRFKTTPVSGSEIKSYPVDISWAGCAANVLADDGAADVASGHGTHVLGSVLGNGAASSGQIQGLAYTAKPTFQAVEQYTTWTGPCDGEPDGYALTGLPLDLYPFFQDAYDWDSRIHSNSWGDYTKLGDYTDDSRAVDQFIWDHPDMLILFAAGNSGVDANRNGFVDERSIEPPGTAKNALTVGASDNLRDTGGYNPGSYWCYYWGTCWPSAFDYNKDPTGPDRISDNKDELAAFSSRGPTDDGRRKPDVVAPGTNILSTRSSEASGTGWGLYPLNPDYLYMGGTSMATPLVAGAAALVREYYVGRGHVPSAALLKATLINSAVDIPGYLNTIQEAGWPIPNNHEGWGRVDVGAATSGDRQFVDGLSVGTGQTWPDTYEIGSSSTPLKVTLVWSDYPASVPAGGLVNDLDMVVTAPGGAVYRGNYFSNGWSVAGGTADRTNNVESVYIQSPAAGQWTVQVSGYNVAEPGGNPQQPFALVATGFFGPPPPPPIADFAGSPTSGERPLQVSFTDLSQNEVTSWDWDFGDLGSSTEPNPTHTYQNAGDYTVSLTATGPGGESTETKTNYIHVLDPPSLVVDHAIGAPGSYFVFTGQDFAPGEWATISVNGVNLASSVQVDGEGGLLFALHTLPTMSTGGYFVTASTGSSASAFFQLVSGADLWPPPPSGTIIDVPASIAPAGSVYLPLVMRNYPAPDPIVNGDFEAGRPPTGWSEHSDYSFLIVVDSGFYVTPHSGVWLAWLGGYSYETAWIEQIVTIPVGRSYLHYWHWRESSASDCSLDKASLRVDGALVVAYDLCTSTNTGRWVEGVVDLSAYAGQTVPLQFRVETSWPASNWYLDDISFEVTAATADANAVPAAEPELQPARKTRSAPDSAHP